MRIPLNEIKTIDNVLTALDQIVAETTKDGNMLGVFAYVYLRTTKEIKKNIINGAFQDNARMEQFDVMFAKYYIEAYYNYIDKKPMSKSWKMALDAGKDKLLIAQHILLGMNAHINLDLGTTAAKIMEHDDLKKLEHDFIFVSNILSQLVSEMQTRLNRVSRFMFLLDWIGENNDQQFISFSIAKAREQSWKLANSMWAAKNSDRASIHQLADNNVALISSLVKNQKSAFVRGLISFILKFEDTNPAVIIQKFSK